jgi:hypothetical protein
LNGMPMLLPPEMLATMPATPTPRRFLRHDAAESETRHRALPLSPAAFHCFD